MTPITLKGSPENVDKFLKLITWTEGTDRDGRPYNVLFGFKYFEGYDRHPGIVVKTANYSSSAAGRYQILKATAKMLKMADFTPESQDLAAIQLIKNAKAYDDVVAGRWEAAINKTNKVWASLPNSPYGQPVKKMADALKFLNSL